MNNILVIKLKKKKSSSKMIKFCYVYKFNNKNNNLKTNCIFTLGHWLQYLIKTYTKCKRIKLFY